MLQTCEGLAEAHVAQIVHRDLKPSNLFRTTRPDGSPLIKILDFGISKVANPGAASVTATSAVLGSPLYMSPEQMMSSKNVDARADIWSLGVVLFQLVSGLPPFEEETLPGLLIAISTKEPRSLTERMGTPPPPELEQVISTCLQKNPAARYQNVAELAVALAPFAPDAQEHVHRVRRVVLGSTVKPTSAPPVLSSGSIRIESSQTQTDPFGRTKTALAGSTPDLAITGQQRRSPIPYLIGGVAALAIVGATVGFVAKQGSTHPTPASSVSLTEAPPLPAASLPSLPASASSPETPSAAPSASATANKPAIKPTSSPGVAAATTKPTATPSSKPSATPSSTSTMSGFTRDRK